MLQLTSGVKTLPSSVNFPSASFSDTKQTAYKKTNKFS